MAGMLLTVGSARAATVEKTVDYTVDGAAYRGYAYYDDAVKDPLPLVLMAPNWMGVTPDNREQARAIAGTDYVVFLVDMYGTEHQPADQKAAGATVKALYADRATLRSRIVKAKEVALRLAKDRAVPADPSKVGVIGFCFGGGVALELARTGDDSAAVVTFHGTLALDAPARNQPIRTRILALHGDADPNVGPDQVAKFEDEMRNGGVDWQLVRFGGAVHSFTDPKANNPGSVQYDPKVARRAFAMMRDFFAEAFGAKKK